MLFDSSELNNISKKEFDNMVEVHGLEVFTRSQFLKFANQLTNIVKSDIGDLDEIEKSQFEEIKDEMEILDRWVVLDWNEQSKKIVKSVFYTREPQVKWDIDEKSGELLKGISGVYLDTDFNRKKHRVGNSYICK